MLLHLRRAVRRVQYYGHHTVPRCLLVNASLSHPSQVVPWHLDAIHHFKRRGIATTRMEPAKALDRAIAAKDVRRALLCFDAMQEPAVITTVQRLAILLAKQKTAPETRRAFEILRSVFA